MSSGNHGRGPLFKKRSAPPQSATTTMLESMLDETSKAKKRRKTKRTKPKWPPEGENNNVHTQQKIIPSTKGLKDAPSIFPKNKLGAVKRPLKPRKVEKSIPSKPPMPFSGALVGPKQKVAEKTTNKGRFPLALNISGGKKRLRDRSGPFPVVSNANTSSNALNVRSTHATTNDALNNKDAVFSVPSFESKKQQESLQETPSLGLYPANNTAGRESLRKNEPIIRAGTNTASIRDTVPPTHSGTMVATTKPKAPEPKRKVNNDNFVRLNMKNTAGACRGARNKSRNKRFENGDKKRPPQKKKMLQSGVDPLDDFVDGVYNNSTTSSSSSKAPQCARHQRACKLLVVKKNTTGNKGRKFYVCSLPRGEQCDHFEWADNTVEAAQRALVRNKSYSGFVARQVAAYSERFEILTVPELRDEAKRRNLVHTGKRKQLLIRLSLWVRDELAAASGGQLEAGAKVKDDPPAAPVAQEVDDSGSDDDSVSSEELELCHVPHQDEANVIATRASEEEDCSDDSDDEDDTPCTSIVNEEATVLTARTDLLKPLTLEQQLKNLFGHEEFREGQEWAVKRCLAKQRTLLVAPTGFGKSLCYALPAALMDGVCIVVSPLISLMQDQLRQLPPRIPAATLSGSLTAAAMAATIDDVIRNRLKILFVSPERLASPSFRRLFQTRWNQETKTRERSFPTISLLCVDEAHCVSQWGHNFRPSYLRLKSLLELMKPESVLAMTATAGPLVVKDICDTLCIPRFDETDGKSQLGSDMDDVDTGVNVSVGSHGVKILAYDRDNIDVCCKVLSSEDERLSLLKKLLQVKKKGTKEDEPITCLDEGSLSHGSVIIYVWRQRDTEVVAENLMASGIEGGIVLYHGGMDSGARAKAQSKFMRGKARICVATVAFGMGINKADVVGVVHLYLPSSPENHLQETGRAGRDGQPAKAIALVLKDEVVVKHSLAHSDMLSTSQIKTILQMLQSLVLETLNAVADDLGQEVESVANYRASFHVALPIESAIKAADCKLETIETLLSLLEGGDGQQPLLNVQGTTTDQATITLKRRSLEKLAKVEKLADCIQKCGTCLDSPEAATNREEQDLQTQENRFLAYSFGSHGFSVTKCASLLGASAEPRHVFATLRRLQNSGELELLLDGTATGRSLHVVVEPCGVEFLAKNDASLDELSSELARRFSANVIASAKKALDTKNILHRIASVDSPDVPEGGMSSSLTLFRELVEAYFEGQDVSDATTADEELPRGVCPGMRNELRIDVSSLLRDMKSFPNFQQPASSIGLDILSPQSHDYSAMALTKFMHGLDTPRAPYAAFGRHPLYGKWRDVEFSSLMKEVEGLLDPYKEIVNR